jgi:hypothetical protein
MNNDLSLNQIDELGMLLAQIDTLTKRADEIKNGLKERCSMSGEKSVDGTMFRAAYIESNRSTVDWKAIAKKLSIPAEVIAAHTSTNAVYSVKVTAR